MKQIPISNGRFVLVDDEDYGWLNQWKWTYGKYAYRRLMHKGKITTIWMHRLILDCPPDKQVDHRNGDPLDNRRSNLRICSPYQNALNRKKKRSDSLSRYIGVSWKGERHNCWVAKIGVKGKTLLIGYFKKEHHAAMAYDITAKECFGDFAKTNFQPVL